MLYVIPTPVGNLEDMTLRAIRLLGEVDVVLAEDTRTSGLLLKHFGIAVGKLQSHHKFNEHHTCHALAQRMAAGETMALISDAGTPAISDPGFMLVQACLEAGVEVQCLPGATAFVPALVSSGLPCDRFAFEGFLPQKKGRTAKLESLASESRTMVFYESPHRILRTLAEMAEAWGHTRPCAAMRELSKFHEQAIRGTLAQVQAHFEQHEPRGEFVLVVGGYTPDKATLKAQKQAQKHTPQHDTAPDALPPLSKYARKQARLAQTSEPT